MVGEEARLVVRMTLPNSCYMRARQWTCIVVLAALAITVLLQSFRIIQLYRHRSNLVDSSFLLSATPDTDRQLSFIEFAARESFHLSYPDARRGVSHVPEGIASGWTEATPLLVREQSLVVEGLDVMRGQLPVPLLGINSDNDNAFVNESLITYCTEQKIAFTRSRPCRKNDQAWIEQKNGAIIRRFVGYARFSGPVAAQTLANLYRNLRLYVNFFQPSFKLLSKHREGSKVKKSYTKPVTPCDRLIADSRVQSHFKEALIETRGKLDPMELLHSVRMAQSALASLASPGTVNHEQKRELDEFLAQLPRLWGQGEVRPTHRQTPATARDYRTRKDPFDGVWTEILSWLEKEPDATGQSLFARLQEAHPGKFSEGQVRTLQRRVRQWRHIMAKKLIYNTPAT